MSAGLQDPSKRRGTSSAGRFVFRFPKWLEIFPDVGRANMRTVQPHQIGSHADGGHFGNRPWAPKMASANPTTAPTKKWRPFSDPTLGTQDERRSPRSLQKERDLQRWPVRFPISQMARDLPRRGSGEHEDRRATPDRVPRRPEKAVILGTDLGRPK